ncbi:MAG: DUF421 domain-containing protein [Ruminococcaceae bacterium]|nr:DUF421 domain-containing protein [Oscillospiraceae bacterium]
MLIVLIRTLIIYIAIIFIMRILGKRQIGELQPAELVITIIVSQVLSIPLENLDIPLFQMFVPILLLVGCEILVSVLSLKSGKFRSLVQGNSVAIIENGILNEKRLRDLRFTVDDLMEALRKKDVFDISEVEYAVVETDGTLSVMLNGASSLPTVSDMNITKQVLTPYVVVSDGEAVKDGLESCGSDKDEIAKILSAQGLSVNEVFIMTLDKEKNCYIIKKEAKK